MTNKPTIIDEINVSECEHFTQEQPQFDITCLFNALKNKNKCEDSPNCYYKQLQRMKEKYKPLDDEYFNGLEIKTIVELAKKSIRITSENIKLKKENEQLMEDLTALQQTYEACKKEYKALSIKYSSAVSFMKKKIQKTTPNDVGKKAP